MIVARHVAADLTCPVVDDDANKYLCRISQMLVVLTSSGSSVMVLYGRGLPDQRLGLTRWRSNVFQLFILVLPTVTQARLHGDVTVEGGNEQQRQQVLEIVGRLFEYVSTAGKPLQHANRLSLQHVESAESMRGDW